MSSSANKLSKKRKTVKSESTLIPEKVFVIDRNQDVVNITNGESTTSKNSDPFAIPASVIDFSATTANSSTQIKMELNDS